MEVQAHGFSWEKDVLRNIFHLDDNELKLIQYTNKFDLPSSLNKLDNFDVSIKTSCSPNSVCMADCLRIFDSVNNETPYHMIVIQYKQIGTTKKVVSIIEVDLTTSANLLFGSITRSEIEELVRLIKCVPQNRKPTTEERTTMYSFRDILQQKSGAIRLDIKCNSTQSRLQCSFNHFKEFIEKNPTRIIAQSNTNSFRGGTISAEIISSRRVFKKKQNQ